MQDRADQYAAGKRLLSAVVSLAILDACQKPFKRYNSARPELTEDAETALRFLFDDTRWCDLYLSMMGIEPSTFRHYLLKTMAKQQGVREVTPEKQRIFNLNYRLYWKKHGRVEQVPKKRIGPKATDR